MAAVEIMPRSVTQMEQPSNREMVIEDAYQPSAMQAMNGMGS